MEVSLNDRPRRRPVVVYRPLLCQGKHQRRLQSPRVAAQDTQRRCGQARLRQRIERALPEFERRSIPGPRRGTHQLMRPETELVLRQAHQIFADHEPIVVVDPPDEDSVAHLEGDATGFWIRHYRVATAEVPAATRVETDALWRIPPGLFRRALIYLPKGRRLQKMTFAQVKAGLCAESTVFVVGANQSGIKGAKSPLVEAMGPVRTIDAARRCTLFAATVKDPGPAFVHEDWCLEWSATVGPRTVKVATYPGTFSDGALDEGTVELLTAVEKVSLGRYILDMGCGSGVIGAMVGKYHPEAEVTLVDASAFAIASAAVTIRINELSTAVVQPSDWYAAIERRFDAILCNPPFHEGVRTDTTMAERVIRGARDHLTPNGELWLVANRFLPYLDTLRATFTHVETVRETTRFKVYRCRAPVDRPSSSRGWVRPTAGHAGHAKPAKHAKRKGNDRRR